MMSIKCKAFQKKVYKFCPVNTKKTCYADYPCKIVRTKKVKTKIDRPNKNIYEAIK
jgi:hypothetical protein